MKFALSCMIAVFVCLPAVAQQTDINRYTIYTGFDSMISPARSLTEYGFDVDFGVTVKPWLGLGGDFGALGNSIISGPGTINGSETVYAPRLMAAGIPPGAIHVPFNSSTYTFAVGPQIYLRKWKKVTLLVRPGFGGIHETANLTFPPQLPPLFELLQIPPPNSHQTDTTWFIGLGGRGDCTCPSPKCHPREKYRDSWLRTRVYDARIETDTLCQQPRVLWHQHLAGSAIYLRIGPRRSVSEPHTWD